MSTRSDSSSMFVDVPPRPVCETRQQATRSSCPSSLPSGSGPYYSIEPGASILLYQQGSLRCETAISPRSGVSLSSQGSFRSSSSTTHTEAEDDISSPTFIPDDESTRLDFENLTISDPELERETSDNLPSLGDKDVWPRVRSEISPDDQKLVQWPESSSSLPKSLFSDARPSSKHLDRENAGATLRSTLVSQGSYFLNFGFHSGIRVSNLLCHDEELEYTFVHCLDRHNMHTQLVLPQEYNPNSRVETLPVLTCTASPHAPKFADEYVCIEYSKNWHKLGKGIRFDVTLSQAQPGQSSSRFPTYQIAFTKPTYLGIRIESEPKTNLYVYRENPQESPRLDEASIQGLEILLADHVWNRR